MKFKLIGEIQTPYIDNAPYQPIDNDKGEFKVILKKKYIPALKDLDNFKYMYVIYYIDRLNESSKSIINPLWLPNTEVGVFASRAPQRPNPIGLSVVQINKICENIIFTSGLDVFNHTPLLDIKPYVKELDSKSDANYGWLDDSEKTQDHLLLHIKGIVHEH
jgi:tRNA (adenine37-N6)-methyltransferase